MTTFSYWTFAFSITSSLFVWFSWIYRRPAFTKNARNELRKISAAFFNTIAAGIILVAVAIPAILYSVENPTKSLTFENFVSWLVYAPVLLFSFGLHFVARSFLARIED